MIKEEFAKTKWGIDTEVKYKDKIYSIGSVNFEEYLVGLWRDDEEIEWVRCENVDLLTNNKK